MPFLMCTFAPACICARVIREEVTAGRTQEPQYRAASPRRQAAAPSPPSRGPACTHAYIYKCVHALGRGWGRRGDRYAPPTSGGSPICQCLPGRHVPRDELLAACFFQPVLAGLRVGLRQVGTGELALGVAAGISPAPALHGAHQELRPRRTAVVGGGVDPACCRPCRNSATSGIPGTPMRMSEGGRILSRCVEYV